MFETTNQCSNFCFVVLCGCNTRQRESNIWMLAKFGTETIVCGPKVWNWNWYKRERGKLFKEIGDAIHDSWAANNPGHRGYRSLWDILETSMNNFGWETIKWPIFPINFRQTIVGWPTLSWLSTPPHDQRCDLKWSIAPPATGSEPFWKMAVVGNLLNTACFIKHIFARCSNLSSLFMSMCGSANGNFESPLPCCHILQLSWIRFKEMALQKHHAHKKYIWSYYNIICFFHQWRMLMTKWLWLPSSMTHYHGTFDLMEIFPGEAIPEAELPRNGRYFLRKISLFMSIIY